MFLLEKTVICHCSVLFPRKLAPHLVASCRDHLQIERKYMSQFRTRPNKNSDGTMTVPEARPCTHAGSCRYIRLGCELFRRLIMTQTGRKYGCEIVAVWCMGSDGSGSEMRVVQEKFVEQVRALNEQYVKRAAIVISELVFV